MCVCVCVCVCMCVCMYVHVCGLVHVFGVEFELCPGGGREALPASHVSKSSS